MFLKIKNINHLFYAQGLHFQQRKNYFTKKVRKDTSWFIVVLGGRILLFTSNICSAGSGSLTYREDNKLYNTDKEKVLLSPVNDTYIKMA